MITYREATVQKALSMVGYVEKRTNADLYDKTANAGSNNFTMFAEWYGSLQGNAWCAMFSSWSAGSVGVPETVFPKHSYTPTGANWFKKHNRWQSRESGYKPKRGDVIYYHNDVRICHVGIVTGSDDTYVYTVEGNTSSAAGVVANGGAVATKKYKLTYNRISGYGTPDYESLGMTMSTEEVRAIVNEEVYKMTIEYLDKMYNSNNYITEPSKWFVEDWKRVCNTGTVPSAIKLFDGTNPTNPLTREQCAAIIARICNLYNLK